MCLNKQSPYTEPIGVRIAAAANNFWVNTRLHTIGLISMRIRAVNSLS